MKPIETLDLTGIYAELQDELISLLDGLTLNDWDRPTAAGSWLVRDIAAHLLDSDIRRLSFQRDCMPLLPPDKPIESYGDLVGFLDQLNADWVKAARRMSPRVMADLHGITGRQVCELFRSLDPHGEAFFPVAWAGEEKSLNWFDIAREYTEKWHHQQQIRDALGKSPLTARKWLHPVIATFLRGLPHAYRNAAADDDTSITFEITGEAGGAWTLRREKGQWLLYEGDSQSAACRVRADQDTAWRMLTKGLTREQAANRTTIAGDRQLGEPFLGMLAIMG